MENANNQSKALAKPVHEDSTPNLHSVKVEKILDSKYDQNGELLYHVQWKNSWKPAKHLVPFEALVREFWEEKRKTDQDTGYITNTRDGTFYEPAPATKSGNKVHSELIFGKNPITGENEYVKKVVNAQGMATVSIMRGLPPEPDLKKKKAANIMWVKPGVVIRSEEDEDFFKNRSVKNKCIQTPYAMFPKEMRNKFSISPTVYLSSSNISGVVQLNNKISRGTQTETWNTAKGIDAGQDFIAVPYTGVDFVEVQSDDENFTIKQARKKKMKISVDGRKYSDKVSKSYTSSKDAATDLILKRYRTINPKPSTGMDSHSVSISRHAPHSPLTKVQPTRLLNISKPKDFNIIPATDVLPGAYLIPLLQTPIHQKSQQSVINAQNALIQKPVTPSSQDVSIQSTTPQHLIHHPGETGARPRKSMLQSSIRVRPPNQTIINKTKTNATLRKEDLLNIKSVTSTQKQPKAQRMHVIPSPVNEVQSLPSTLPVVQLIRFNSSHTAKQVKKSSLDEQSNASQFALHKKILEIIPDPVMQPSEQFSGTSQKALSVSNDSRSSQIGKMTASSNKINQAIVNTKSPTLAVEASSQSISNTSRFLSKDSPTLSERNTYSIVKDISSMKDKLNDFDISLHPLSTQVASRTQEKILNDLGSCVKKIPSSLENQSVDGKQHSLSRPVLSQGLSKYRTRNDLGIEIINVMSRAVQGSKPNDNQSARGFSQSMDKQSQPINLFAISENMDLKPHLINKKEVTVQRVMVHGLAHTTSKAENETDIKLSKIINPHRPARGENFVNKEGKVSCSLEPVPDDTVKDDSFDLMMKGGQKNDMTLPANQDKSTTASNSVCASPLTPKESKSIIQEVFDHDHAMSLVSSPTNNQAVPIEDIDIDFELNLSEPLNNKQVEIASRNIKAEVQIKDLTVGDAKKDVKIECTTQNKNDDDDVIGDDKDFPNINADIGISNVMPPLKTVSTNDTDQTHPLNIPDVIEFEFEPWKVAKEVDETLTCFTRIDGDNYGCGKCARTFKQERGVINHLRSVHYGWYPYTCPLCKKGYIDRREIYRHMDAHLGIKQYPCNTCDKMFLTSQERKCHYKEHYYERRFQCDVCGVRFGRRSALISHQLIHDFKKQYYPCQYCARTFTFFQDYKTHKRLHTGEKPFKCKDCDKAYRRKEHLTHHMFVHTGKSEYQCKICMKYFQTRKILSHHNRMNHNDIELLKGVYEYFCSICFAIFDNKQYLDRHERHKHLIELKKRVYCRVCKLPCETWADKRRHEFKYHSSVPTSNLPKSVEDVDVSAIVESSNADEDGVNRSQYQCVFCDRCLTNPVTLTKHYETHAQTNDEEDCEDYVEIVDNISQLKYKCSYCNFGFKEYTELFQHESGHKTYPQGLNDCYDCSISFKYPSMLVIHLNSGHESMKGSTIKQQAEQPEDNTKKDSCEICSKQFPKGYSSSYKEWHFAKQHGGPTANFYQCSLCDQLLQTERELEKHNFYKHSTFDCPYCSIQLPTHAKLMKHLNDFHTCMHCKAKYGRTEDLRVHLHIKHLEHTPETLFSCCLCADEFVFADKTDLEAHLEIKHGISAEGVNTECYKSMTEKEEVERMIENVLMKTVTFNEEVLKKPELPEYRRKDTPLDQKKKDEQITREKQKERKQQTKKETCTEKFEFPYALRNHRQTHHLCSNCGFTSQNVETLEKHIVQCPDSKSRLMNETSLSSVFRKRKVTQPETSDETKSPSKKKTVAKSEPNNIFKCKICQQFFPSLDHVRKHVPAHFK